MSWIKLDDGFLEHPKQVAAGIYGRAFWLAGLAFCNRQKQKTGIVPDYAIDGILAAAGIPTSKRKQMIKLMLAIPMLCETSLWERVDGGYHIHDYEQYQVPERQKTAEEIRAVRAVRVEAGRQGGIKSGQVRRGEVEANTEANDDFASSLLEKTKQNRSPVSRIPESGIRKEEGLNFLPSLLYEICTPARQEFEERVGNLQFVIPEFTEVDRYAKCYAARHGVPNVAYKFYRFHQANGWRVGQSQIYDWKAAYETYLERGIDMARDVRRVTR